MAQIYVCAPDCYFIFNDFVPLRTLLKLSFNSETVASILSAASAFRNVLRAIVLSCDNCDFAISLISG